MNKQLKALLEIDPGAGNLRMDVFFASAIGPQRVAHGAKDVKVLTAGQAVKIAATTGAGGSHAVSFVRVYLATNQTGPVAVLFGTSETLGNTAIPVNLIGTATAGQEVSRHFDAILLPSEELYAQSSVGVSLIISRVWF